MSGHSHAKKIRHQKEISDKKRGQIFSKMARMIAVAVREGGSNPETNSKLRLVFEMAKKINMPKENIEKAINRGTGALGEENLEEFSFEAYGPGGVALIIEGITDNKNRTINEIKQILNEKGGKLVGEGAVKWMFEKRGVIVVDLKSQEENLKNKEALEIAAIEGGALDIEWDDEIMTIYTKVEELEKVKNNLEERKIKIESTSLDWVPKEEISLDEKTKETCQQLFEILDENEAVQEIYSNLKI